MSGELVPNSSPPTTNSLGAVYKIVSIEDEDGNMRDTIKLSSNAEKVSTPGKKQVWRITSKEKENQKGLHHLCRH